MNNQERIYFLSASVPYGKRALEYKPDPIAVRDAVQALVSVVIRDSMLVFGGHPAITPLIWDAVGSIEEDYMIDKGSRSVQNGKWDYRLPNRFHRNIVVYQSEFFKKIVPKASTA